MHNISRKMLAIFRLTRTSGALAGYPHCSRGLWRWLSVPGLGKGVVGSAMLGFLDARSLSHVLFFAEHQRNREALLMGRTLLVRQPVLVLDLVEPGELVHQAHRRLLASVCQIGIGRVGLTRLLIHRVVVL